MSCRRSEIRDHGSTRYQIPPFSPRERSGPEPPRYRPLSYGYGPQLNASPYDPIVPEYPTPSFGQGFRPDSYRNPPLGYGSGPQVNVSPYDPIVPSYPTLSFGQGFRPEASRYPPLESGYRPRVQTSPYDPIVPGNRNPVRRGERAAEEDDNEDETPSVLRNTKRPRRRPQTD